MLQRTQPASLCVCHWNRLCSSSGVILGESYSKKPRGLGKAWLHPLFAPGLIAESRSARVWDIIRFIRSSFSLRCRSLISRITYHHEKKARIQRDGCIRELTLYVHFVCFTNVLTLHFSPAACVEAANAQSLKCMDYRSCCGLFQHRGQWIKPNVHFTSVEERKSSYQAQNRSVERPL